MSSGKRVALWIAVALAAGAVVPARSAAQEVGRVTGTAVEAETGNPLVGAAVTLPGTNLIARTDDAGRFTFLRVPAGPRTIALTYLGREPQERSISVPAGGEVTVQLSSPVSALVLSGIDVRVSRALVQAEALNRQRTAPNIQNIVASDQIGRFPDASAPEAVQRVPGVSIARDQGEGRYIQIRGGSAANTMVTFNGVQVPSPEGEMRQIALDAVPVDILESIEVSKAILPDMDADAVGGAVNLVTRRSPLSRVMSFETSGGFAPIREDASGSAAVTFGDAASGGRLGYLLSGSYSRRSFGSDDVEPSFDLGDEDPSDDVLEELDVRYYSLWRERLGLNAALDFRLSETSALWLTGIFSSMTDQEQRRSFVSVLEDDALEWLHKNREESLQTYSLTLGGEHLATRNAMVDYTLSWARSLENTPFDTEIAFVREDVAFAPDISDPANVRSNPSAGSLGGDYLFDSIEPASSDTRNTDLTGSLNLTFPFAGDALTGKLRTGLRFRDKTKIQRVTEEEYELSDGDLMLGADVGNPFGLSLRYPGTYDLPEFATSPGDVTSFVGRFRSQLEREENVEADTQDYDLDERVLAGYVMAELNLGPALMLLPGVRYEQTSFESAGFAWDSETEELTPVASDRSYGNIFPMLHARYSIGTRSNLRAAFTTTIARPNFYDLVPFRVRDDEDLVLGNPALKPTIARNLDLLFERYDDRIGVVSAGLFYKSLTDPIFVFVSDNDLGGETEQPGNGEEGWIRGVELAIQSQLGGGFGIYGNYTFTDSEAELPGGRTARLQGQSDHVFNTALSYERGGIGTQLSLNFHNDYVEEYAEDAYEDVYIDKHLQLDATASYRLGRSTLFLELVNLTNEPLVAYQGNRDRPIQTEYYEPWGRLGVKVNW